MMRGNRARMSRWPIGPGGNSAPVQQFFNRLITLPSAADQAIYATLINGLVADGVWGLLDVLLVTATQNAGNSLVNLPNGTYTPTLVGSPGFTSYRGWSPNGTVDYVDTGFNPTAAAGHFSLNSASMLVWQLTNTAAANAILRTTATVSDYLDFSLTTFGGAINTVSEVLGAIASSNGCFLGNRPASNSVRFLQNNTLITSAGSTATSMENLDMMAGYGRPTSDVYAAVAFSAGLTPTQETALFTRLQTCLHAFGAV